MNKRSSAAMADLDRLESKIKEGDTVEVITPHLIKSCKDLNLKIDLRQGTISKETSKKGKFIKSLKDQLYVLVATGECYPGLYYDVFGFSSSANMAEGITSKTNKRVDLRSVYPNEIKQLLESTMIERYGVTHNWAHGELRDELETKWVEKYGVKNPLASEEIQSKRKQTMLDRYGVEHYTDHEDFKPKVKATMLERYGVEHNWCKGDLRDDLEAMWIDKYGVDNPMKSEEVRERMKSTCFERYGVDYPLQSEEIYNATKETLSQNYGVYIPLQSPIIQAKHRQTLIERYGVDHQMRIPEVVEKVAAKIRETVASKDPRYAKVYDWLMNGYEDANEVIEFLTENYDYNLSLHYLKLLGLKSKKEYMTELKLRALLDKLGVGYIHNTKRSHGVLNLNGSLYESDVFIPSHRISIEINGRAYHSVNKAAMGNLKAKDYHFEKFKAFRESGILMLSFTDYEQDHFKSDYENIIKHHLLGEPLNISKEFLEFNQISNIEESLNYGLFDPNQFTGNFEDHQHQRFIEDYEYWDCGVIK